MKIVANIDRFDVDSTNYEKCVYTVKGNDDDVMFEVIEWINKQTLKDNVTLLGFEMAAIADANELAKDTRDYGSAVLKFNGRAHDISFQVVRD